jgi:hypothetical protein
MTSEDYFGKNPKVKEFENRWTELLLIEYSGKQKNLGHL